MSNKADDGTILKKIVSRFGDCTECYFCNPKPCSRSANEKSQLPCKTLTVHGPVYYIWVKASHPGQ